MEGDFKPRTVELNSSKLFDDFVTQLAAKGDHGVTFIVKVASTEHFTKKRISMEVRKNGEHKGKSNTFTVNTYDDKDVIETIQTLAIWRRERETDLNHEEIKTEARRIREQVAEQNRRSNYFPPMHVPYEAQGTVGKPSPFEEQPTKPKDWTDHPAVGHIIFPPQPKPTPEPEKPQKRKFDFTQ